MPSRLPLLCSPFRRVTHAYRVLGRHSKSRRPPALCHRAGVHALGQQLRVVRSVQTQSQRLPQHGCCLPERGHWPRHHPRKYADGAQRQLPGAVQRVRQSNGERRRFAHTFVRVVTPAQGNPRLFSSDHRGHVYRAWGVMYRQAYPWQAARQQQCDGDLVAEGEGLAFVCYSNDIAGSLRTPAFILSPPALAHSSRRDRGRHRPHVRRRPGPLHPPPPPHIMPPLHAHALTLCPQTDPQPDHVLSISRCHLASSVQPAAPLSANFPPFSCSRLGVDPPQLSRPRPVSFMPRPWPTSLLSADPHPLPLPKAATVLCCRSARLCTSNATCAPTAASTRYLIAISPRCDRCRLVTLRARVLTRGSVLRVRLLDRAGPLLTGRLHAVAQ